MILDLYNSHQSLKMMIVMGKMHNAIMDQMHSHLKVLGVNQTEFLVLYALAAQGKLTIQEIGEKIFITSGSMTYTIDKLEERGYIRRIRCLEDRRKIFIDLTSEGAEFFEKAMKEHVDYLDMMVQDVQPGDLDQFIELTKKIGKTIERR